MLRAYKFRIYPNKQQAVLFAKHFGCTRWIWNWALARRVELWNRDKKSIHCFLLKKEIPSLKKSEETKWLSEVNSQSLQASIRNLDSAYTRFFREKKGFPNFKSKRGRQSFQCPQRCFVDFNTKQLNIPKVSNIQYRDGRQFSGKIRTVTISRNPSGKCFVSILVEDGKKEPTPKKLIRESNVVGVDLGLKHFATLSTGEKIDNPKRLKAYLRKLKRAQRALSRKHKGGDNWEKCRQRLAITHEKISNQRKDFQAKLSTRLIRENQAVALETLNVAGMTKNRRLSAAIQDAAWDQFVNMLEYKARWNGKTVLRIGTFEPSSKLCSCGVINNALTLKDRKWTCQHCGITHDRDVLAANNIKRMALHPQNFFTAGYAGKLKPVESHRGSLKQEWIGVN